MKSDTNLSVTGLRIWTTVSHIEKKQKLSTRNLVSFFVYTLHDAFSRDLGNVERQEDPAASTWLRMPNKSREIRTLNSRQ